jgi:predicted benzoate:H+ symporter BenE
MWLGIAANVALAVPTLVAPVRMLALMDFPVPDPIVWTRFAALLLLLLSAFYAPAALDPDRYRASAWIAVASRLAGVTFFGVQARAYWPLGAFDLVFLVPQAVLLARLSR